MTAQWMNVQHGMAEQVQQWSGREGILAEVGPEAGQGIAAALFTFDTNTMEVNSFQAFGKHVRPHQVGDWTDRKTLFDWPVAAGATLHEAGHAKHTIWDRREVAGRISAKVFNWLDMLEEVRIERWMLGEFPQNRAFLRASANKLVIGELTTAQAKKLGKVRAAARTAVLTMGRQSAGIVEAADIKKTSDIIRETIPVDILQQLQDIWEQFMYLRANQIERMIDLAEQFTAIIDKLAEDKGEKEPLIIYVDGKPPAGVHDHPPMDDDGEDPDVIFVFKEAAEEDGEGAETGAQREAHDQEAKERGEADQAKRDEEAREAKENQKVADEVFNNTKAPGGAQAPQRYTGHDRTGSRLSHTQTPGANERRAAVILGDALDRAKYRDRDVVKHNTILPPGRLRTRTAMQGDAYRDRGQFVVPETFRRIDKFQTDEPTIKIGMLTDISGSMSSAMLPMGVLNWVISEAIRRIDGVAASVYFGASVFPVLKPYEHLEDIQVYTTPDGQHAFSKAFKALDGALGLLGGTGPRLLVPVSDGAYGWGENEGAVAALERCRQERVAVVWLGFSKTDPAAEYCRQTGATHVVLSTNDPLSAVNAVGAAMEQALTTAGRE